MTSGGQEPLTPERQRLRCFVIGPIGNRFAAAGSPEREQYEEAIQVLEEVILPACGSVGLAPVRADGLARAGEITEQIFRRLRDDDVVVADLTGANANVMYELGLRHTRNMLTVQIGEYGRLPFDVNVIRTVQFSRSAHGLITARNELIEIIETGLTGEYDWVTATRIWNEGDVGSLSVDVAEEAGEQPAGDEGSESPGFIDLIADAEESQQTLSDATNAIARRIAELGQAATAATERTARSDAQGSGMRGRLAVVTEYAREVDAIADRLEADVRDYEAAMSSVSAGNLALIQRLEEDPGQLSEGMDFGRVLRRLAAQSREGIESQRGMVEALREGARMSRVLREPVNRVVNALGRFATATQLVDEWDRRLQALGVPVPPADWEFPGASAEASAQD